jgi:DNA-binding transcriptional ArsR family regulator
MGELDSVFETVSRYFSILSEPIRVRIVHAICQQERTVNDIVETTGATQTTVSRHLALMYREGVLTRRREGGFVYYIVSDSALAEICRTVCVHVASRDDTQQTQLHSALQVAEAFEVAGGGKHDSRQRAGSKSAADAEPPVSLTPKARSREGLSSTKSIRAREKSRS